MAFRPHLFIRRITTALQRQGFRNTSEQILFSITSGKRDRDDEEAPARAFNLAEQQEIAADTIERNILFAYASWEIAAREIADLTAGRTSGDLDEALKVYTADGDLRVLGSTLYRAPIVLLEETVRRLRGLEEPPTPPVPDDPPPGDEGDRSTIRANPAKKVKATKEETLLDQSQVDRLHLLGFEAGPNLAGASQKLVNEVPYKRALLSAGNDLSIGMEC